ncbi:BREX-1 system adenine-specific DNA-methyltransferase PglX [Pseudomonas aeruginosa]
MSGNQNSSREQGMEKYFFRASAVDFKKIPSAPIAYWVYQSVLDHFAGDKKLEDISKPKQGATTSNNSRFLRVWHEISQSDFGTRLGSLKAASDSRKTWFPYNKGGEFRRWYGNQDFVINYKNDGQEIKDFHEELNKTSPGGRLKNQDCYFKPSVSWSKISSGTFAARYFPQGFIFDVAGSAIFFDTDESATYFCGLLNTRYVRYVLGALSPTLNFEAEHLCKIPVLRDAHIEMQVNPLVEELILRSKDDWDSVETSWDFITLPLLHPDHCQPTLKASYQSLRTHWREMTLEMQRLEEENNRIFIDAYGLQDELTPEVPLEEITLTCNPHYRYGGDKSEEELEALLLADTMRELVSYAVGCMFGRYSLDKPGLILANQGDTLADYLAQVPQPSFSADDDNVIPLLDGDWFADDITLRVRQFLRVAFGDAHYEDNLAFIEQALNLKGKRNYGLRDYLLGEFYADHVKRYKKRPIYWLFSSPKGSFNALIYMHRYRPDTVSVVLRYLRDYREKLVTEKERQAAISINPASSQGDKTRALKETERLGKVLAELEDYERDVLYPLATQQVQIDLDDGVKVNYLKFEGALKKIPGLAAKDED